jgi:hypothetical protein
MLRVLTATMVPTPTQINLKPMRIFFAPGLHYSNPQVNRKLPRNPVLNFKRNQDLAMVFSEKTHIQVGKVSQTLSIL